MTAMIVNQNMAAGGNHFTGVVPQIAAVDVTPTQEGSVFTYNGIDAGGLFDFAGLGQKRAYRIIRVLIDMGDATSWSLVHRTTDGAGNNIDIVLQNEVGAGGSTWTSIADPLDAAVFPGEQILLNSAGGTGARRAQLLISDW